MDCAAGFSVIDTAARSEVPTCHAVAPIRCNVVTTRSSQRGRCFVSRRRCRQRSPTLVLDGHHGVGLEPPDLTLGVPAVHQRSGERRDLAHDFGGLGGFGVGDVDRILLGGADLRQLVGQAGGRQMEAALGQHLIAVAKGGFDDEHGDFKLVHALPERRVTFGVAAEDPVRAAAGLADGEAASRHAVHSGQHFDVFAERAELQGLANDDFVERHKGRVGAGDGSKVGPDHVVEDMDAQRLDGGALRVHAQRLAAAAGDGVDHQRQGDDMVKVGMGQQHVINTGHFVEREIAHTGTGVDQEIVVDQK